MAAALALAKTEQEVLAAVAGTLNEEQRDLPFSLIYLIEPDSVSARLACRSGISEENPAALPVLSLESTEEGWPLFDVLAQAGPVTVDDLSTRFPSLPVGPWDRSPTQGLIVPLAQQGQERPAGFLVVGINPYRRLDTDYIGFVGLLAGQIAAGIANAHAYEEERKRAEALAELDRAKTAFFSNVSHEFRTPLTLMIGPLSDLMEQGNDLGPEVREQLTLIQRNSFRLLRLVNTLLDFSRIEAGRVQAIYEPTDLAQYTQELASVFRSAIEGAGLTFVVDCPPVSEPVYIDRDMWEKIVLNLLSNAFKFTFEGTISVTLRPVGDQAELIVRDTGTGIPEPELPHLFERFRRVDGARGRTHEGTGIGLALVQELVRLHGGTVSVTSEVGKGSAFAVTVPFGTAHLPQDRLAGERTLASTALRAESYVEEVLRWQNDGVRTMQDDATFVLGEASTSEGEERRYRIVLADDNADMREYVRKLLQRQYDVEAVANGEEVLLAVERERPDLVLTDVMMPILDGFGVLHALRSDARWSTLPVILLSARAGEEARVEGREQGADDYLVKPFSAKELLAVVRSHIELSRVRQKAEKDLRERQSEIEALNVRLQRSIRETHHRVKNNLQLTAAMVDLQAMDTTRQPTIEDFRHLGSQIRTLAAVHDLLTMNATEEGDVGVLSAKAVLEKLLIMLQQGSPGIDIAYSLEDCQLPGRQANSLALLTNELVANAMKHGDGKIRVDLTVADHKARLTVRDNGKGFMADFDPVVAAHTGLALVESLAQMDLRGMMSYDNHPSGGAQVHVDFPLQPYREK